MTTAQFLQWAGVVLLWVAGLWSVVRGGSAPDPLRRRNMRMLGWLLMAVGALAFIVAYSAYYG